MINNEIEYILCAATHFTNGKGYPYQPINITEGIVLSGHRHDCIFQQWMFFSTEIQKLDVKGRNDIGFIENDSTQGFLTNKNRFVNRREAAEIAFATGQTQKKLEKLYSEDLY